MVVFEATPEAPLCAIIGTTNVCHETPQIDQTPAASAAATRRGPAAALTSLPCRESITDLPGKLERCRLGSSAGRRFVRRDWCRAPTTDAVTALHHISPSHTHSAC